MQKDENSKESKENVKSKTLVTEMKNTFDDLTNRLDTVKKESVDFKIYQ